jgi:hypothetical protein
MIDFRQREVKQFNLNLLKNANQKERYLLFRKFSF